MADRPRILFLCTGNACRSQMAEGLCRHLRGDVLDPASAGIETHGLDPWAVRVMAEIGLDISGHTSKTVADLGGYAFAWAVTVCDRARETCPWFPATTALVHRGFDDPPVLTAGLEDEEEILAIYRRIRDEIRDYVLSLPGSLPGREGYGSA